MRRNDQRSSKLQVRRTMLLALFFVLWPSSLAVGFEPAADPALATVRIKSHGASGTIIATTPGKSWILGCAHMFLDAHGRPSEAERGRPLRLDGPAQPYADKRRAAARVVACDHDLDLSLIELDNGPLFYITVAKQGHVPGKRLLSVGYDTMAWPVTQKPATLVSTSGNWTYTAEKPWHGRSGGGLIDAEARCLIGVVHGYEIRPQGRGIYISHTAVLTFLSKHWKQAPAPPLVAPVPQWPQRLMLPSPC
jgi:hypothetical protein